MSSSINALDLHSSPANNFSTSIISGLGGIGSGDSVVSGFGDGHSVSSKSVRRRDVIRPMMRDDDETANSVASSKDDAASSVASSASSSAASSPDNDSVNSAASSTNDSAASSTASSASSKEETASSANDSNDYNSSAFDSSAFVLVNNKLSHDADHIGDITVENNENSPTSEVLHSAQDDIPHSSISPNFILQSPTSTQPSTASRQLVQSPPPHQTLQKQKRRGMDPDEMIHDKSFLHSDGPSDPPGESPNDRPAVCMDIVPFGGSAGSSRQSYYSGRRNFRSVQWMDPKGMGDEGEVDYNVLRHYEQLTTSTNNANDNQYQEDPTPITNALQQTSILLKNPRTRIATISSGYKKANYFVREDLDTRIYFHQLEDAIGYMAKRGYCKMRGEEAREWKDLLGRAHGVVKVGPTKKKQHYRKGKLVLILKKTISDTDAIKSSSTALVVAKKKKKKKKSSSRRKSRHSSSRSETSSTYSQTSSQVTDSSQSTDFSESATTNNTERTSLGKTLRAGYSSYSEKFLAQQESEKKRYLLAIMEGRPLDDFGYNAAKVGQGGAGGERQLLLTDGSTMGSVDPDADRTIVSSRNGDTTTRGGSTATSNSRSSGTSCTSYNASCTTSGTESKKSSVKKSTRRGVYGGGVQYFTPQQSYREEDEEHSEEGTEEGTEEGSEESHSTDNEDFEEEGEDSYSHDNTVEEEESGSNASNNNTMDVEGSDMGSMLSEESNTYCPSSAGVESVTSMSTAEHYESSRKSKGSSRRARSPPEMTPISDDSASYNSR